VLKGLIGVIKLCILSRSFAISNSMPRIVAECEKDNCCQISVW